MGSPPDSYEVLNISKHSSPQEIREAYKTLVKKWHPDKHPISSKSEAEARFKTINEAYKALNDQKYRSNMITPSVGLNHLKPSKEDSKNMSHSTTSFSWKKPLPMERKLECTLEELCWGCKKEIKFTIDVVTNKGLVIQKPESCTISVKPGWRKGTRITIEGIGGQRPGSLPADLVIIILEKKHPFYKRIGNDLALKAEVSLANALAGWTFSFRLLDGKMMSCSFDDEIVFPEYEKVIKGQGMPMANEKGKRGDMRIKFHIVFPLQLSKEQQLGVAEILRDSI